MKQLFVLALLVFAARSPAQERPVAGPDGTWVVEDRVSLLAAAPAGCIALEAAAGEATIVLPLKEIVDLASRAGSAPNTVHVVISEHPPAKPVLEPRHARELLKLVQPVRDGRGCKRLQTEQLPMTLSWLVGGLMEEGHAAVYTRHWDLAEPALIVRHVTSEVFAYDDLVLLDGTHVWHVPLWIR